MVQGRGRLHVHVQGVGILSGCSWGDACMCAKDDQHTEVRVGCVWEGRRGCMCVVWAGRGGEEGGELMVSTRASLHQKANIK